MKESHLTLPLPSIFRAPSLHEQTYKALRIAILSGELVAGARLVETQLAEMFQVSRTPVREAIRQLQRENLVRADEQGTLRVALLSIADAVHLYDCRIALEQLSVSEACAKVTDAQLEQLKLVVQQAEKTSDQQSHSLTPYQLLHMDYQFHRLLAESSDNPWLVSLLDQVFDKMALLRLRTLQHNPRVLEICSEHQQIYQAISDRNSKTAIKAIKSHLIASKKRVIREIQQLDQRGDAADVSLAPNS
ncbi:GntR family transcriptional regulator [Kovacikia minuta CCNUW1]|uniref:GntR family transcriptional regulator n=1 Tax=Kovacikia minuta TaxID=2931930 RepID=UPI001CC9BA24|nr:GntR family transcriptional regulator [Kovacikia minuta]UBF28034.1 GntR family transcriptional regulator [Kovacikia minuta CCNUW1]